MTEHGKAEETEYPLIWKRTTDEDNSTPHHVDLVWEDRTESFHKKKHRNPDKEARKVKREYMQHDSAELLAAGEQIYTADESEDEERKVYESTPYVIYDRLPDNDNILTIIYDSYVEVYHLEEVYRGKDHMLNVFDDVESYYRGNGFSQVGVSIHMSPSRFGSR